MNFPPNNSINIKALMLDLSQQDESLPEDIERSITSKTPHLSKATLKHPNKFVKSSANLPNWMHPTEPPINISIVNTMRNIGPKLSPQPSPTPIGFPGFFTTKSCLATIGSTQLSISLHRRILKTPINPNGFGAEIALSL